MAVSGDPAEDVLAIGQFSGSATLGGTSLVAAAGTGSAWIARLASTDGSVQWALAPMGESKGRGVSALGGDAVIAGTFRGTQQWSGLAPLAPARAMICSSRS